MYEKANDYNVQSLLQRLLTLEFFIKDKLGDKISFHYLSGSQTLGL